LFLRKKIQFECCSAIFEITYLIYKIFILGSLLNGINKGNLTYMLIFKYGFIAVIIKSFINFIKEFTPKSEKEENKRNCAVLPTRTIYLIMEVVYYILTVYYINTYEAYLKN
ncbi:hypothetical protein U3516DRAFT_553685, partial [Neocallimastix sp. 'constans']